MSAVIVGSSDAHSAESSAASESAGVREEQRPAVAEAGQQIEGSVGVGTPHAGGHLRIELEVDDRLGSGEHVLGLQQDVRVVTVRVELDHLWLGKARMLAQDRIESSSRDRMGVRRDLLVDQLRRPARPHDSHRTVGVLRVADIEGNDVHADEIPNVVTKVRQELRVPLDAENRCVRHAIADDGNGIADVGTNVDDRRSAPDFVECSRDPTEIE